MFNLQNKKRSAYSAADFAKLDATNQGENKMRQTREISLQINNVMGIRSIVRGLLPLRRKVAAIGILSAVVLMSNPAFAEEDCFNGPVPVEGTHRGQINVPQGHAVRLTFNFNAAWENMVFVCDALTGHRLLVKGNYSRDREDWVSPIDNTRSLTYYVVAFHKTVSPEASDAGDHPWIQSPMKVGDRVIVEGKSGAYVDSYGFNDGGGQRWDNALVDAYFIGDVGVAPKALSTTALQKLRMNPSLETKSLMKQETKSLRQMP